MEGDRFGDEEGWNQIVSRTQLDCAAVREGDYIDRYVAGRLPDPEAEAFEAHYFGCETCWQDLQSALQARAALVSQATIRGRPPSGGRAWRWIGWTTGIAAAAAAAFLIFNIGSNGGPGGPEDVFRGSRTAIQVQTSAADGAIVATWAAVPDADIYVARVYSEDGGLLYERETAAARAEVTRADLARADDLAVVYWRVVALDSLRQPVARSPLVPVRLRSP